MKKYPTKKYIITKHKFIKTIVLIKIYNTNTSLVTMLAGKEPTRNKESQKLPTILEEEERKRNKKTKKSRAEIK